MAPGKSELIDSAQRYAQKGQLDKAIKDYQHALQIDSGDIQTRLRLGDVFAKKGATREAIEQYFRVAERHSADGFYLKAIAVHKQILKLDAAFIDSSSRLADLYHKQGLLSDALTTYQRVAAVYDKKGQVREALDTLTKMADLDPQNVAIRVKLGELYLKASIKESGVEQLLKAAELYEQTDRHAEQTAVLDKVLACGPLSPAATRSVVTALLAAGKVEPALSRVKALVAKTPDDPALRELQAEVHLKAGDAATAAEALTAVLERSPERIETRLRLVELHLDAGDAEAAAEAASGFTPASVPPNRLDAAAAAVSTLTTRAPAPPDAVQAVLLRQLAAIHEARKDPAGQAAAMAALTGLTDAGAGLGAGLEPGLDQPGPVAAATPGRPAGRGVVAAPPGAAELTIEIDDAMEAPADAVFAASQLDPDGAPLGDAAPLDAVVDTSATELTVDGAEEAFADVALEPPAVAARAAFDPADALSLDAEGEGGLDLSLDLDAGADTAPLDTVTVDAAALDEPPLDTLTVDAAPRAGSPALEGGGPRGRAAGSPEANVLSVGDAELALDQIPEELDEAEFFVQQGLVDAARAIYKRILAVDPEHPLALERLARLTGGGAGAAPAAPAARPSAEPVAPKPLAARAVPGAPQSSARAAATKPRPCASAERPAPGSVPARVGAGAPPGSDATESFDLAAVLADETDGPAALLLEDREEQVSFQEVFREFKKGVERQVGDDPETHYNLGIAYKEMGLVEDAIAEFERALADPGRSFDCYTMIGLAHLARGDADSAIAAFETGLGHADADPRQSLALTYELGVAFEAGGRLDEARGAFATVAATDPRFRDVSDRLAALGGAPGAVAGAGAEVFDPQSLLADDLAYVAEGTRPAARPAAAKPSPARAAPGAPHSSARPAGRPSAQPGGTAPSPTRAVPGAPHSSKRDKISFV